MSSLSDLERVLNAICDGAEDAAFDCAAVSWREALPVLAAYLRRPLRIERAERIEALFKQYLRYAFAEPLSGEDARFIADVSKTVGFILKFKPYGVKCATPLGYSVFFLRPGMGFSFQRHRTRKTELFHMLKTLERGQVYISTSKEWDEAYDKDAFNRWLDGTPDARFQKYSRRPDPGDVYLVTELDTVHSVLGCVLEEYATVSTDMVDRLHDQNTGRSDSHFVDPETVAAWLSQLPCPMPNMCWASLTSEPEPLPARTGNGVTQVVLADTSEFLAERFEIERGNAFRIGADAERARSLFCLGGSCRVLLAAAGDVKSAASLQLASGDVIIVPPSIATEVIADEKTSISSHTIRPDLALT